MKSSRALRWLAAMSPEGERFAVLGDLEEERRLCGKDGRTPVLFEIWCWGQILRSLPRFLKNCLEWRIQMFKSFVKIAVRNMARHPGYTLINILGLALGLAGCGLIFLFIAHETSFDRSWPEADRIYRVAEEVKSEASTRQYAGISYPFAPAVKSGFPAVEDAARMAQLGPRLVENGEKRFYEEGMFAADPEIFAVFGFPLAEGNPETALVNPDAAVISKAVSAKYFGSEPALGKTVLLNGKPLQITGVFDRLPSASHLKISWLLSMGTIRPFLGREMENWQNTMANTYLKVRPKIDVAAFEKEMSGLADKYIGDRLRQGGQTYRYFLQPVSSIHLESNLLDEMEPPGNRTLLVLLAAAAVLILLIAGFNFINLSTARSARRAREVGIRKVVGAVRRHLVLQHMGESALMTLLAAAAAVAVTVLVLGAFNRLAGTDFSIPDLLSLRVLGFGLAVLALTAFGAGLYPALILSSFKPAATLKGSFASGRRGAALRRVMVVGQFFAAALLVAGTLMIVRQVDFMKNRDLGFAKERKFFLPIRGNSSWTARSEEVKAAFLKHTSVLGAAASSSVPGRSFSSFNVVLEEKGAGSNWSMNHLFIDAEFLKVYDIPMAAGRPFDAALAADRTDDWDEPPVFLVNEAAARTFGFASPGEAVGKLIRTGCGGRTGTIIGVVRDFHYAGLQQAIAPLVMEWFPEMFRGLTLSLGPSPIGETLATVEREWNGRFPGLPMAGLFLDEDFNRQYRSDERTLAIVRLFSGLGLFVACLGLFGLSAFLAEQKRKEIGIRKTLGASAAGIAARFSGSFLGLVLLANVLAVPAAWLAMNRYLGGFAYRAGVSAWPFVAAAGLSLAISFLTVAFQSMRAARTNPADTLRNE